MSETVPSARTLAVMRVSNLEAQFAFDLFIADDVDDMLRRALGTPLVSSAISISSRVLYGQLEKWLAGEKPLSARARLKACSYLVRMSSRTTPFGLCASVARVEFGESTTFELLPEFRTRTRIDMEALNALIREIEQDEAARPFLSYVASDLTAREGDRIKVYDDENTSFIEENGRRGYLYAPVSLRCTAAVERVLELCKGYMPYEGIVADLSSRFNAAREDVDSLLRKLQSGGVLRSNLKPTPIGDQMAALSKGVAKIPGRWKGVVGSIGQSLARIDNDPVSDSAMYERAASAIAEVVPDGTWREKPLQVDSARAVAGTIQASILEDAATMAELLSRCEYTSGMSAYRERFMSRYEGVDRYVPLMDLVDPRTGLGLPEDGFPRPAESTLERQRALFDLYQRSASERASEVELGDEDIALVFPEAKHATPLPEAFEFGITVLAQGKEDINCGKYLIAPASMIFTQAAGKSGARVADLLGTDFAERVREYYDDQDEIRAEIVHVSPPKRGLNVLARPRIHAAEIQFNIHDESAPLRLSPTDLMVGLEGDRFFVFSKSLGRRVRPIETHQLAPYLGTSATKLLSKIAFDQHRMIAGFDWGPLASAPALPRLRYKRLILSLARWIADSAICAGSREQTRERVESWRRQWNVSRHVMLIGNETRLLLDLESDLGIDLLLDQRDRAADHLVFEEAFSPELFGWNAETGKGYAADIHVSQRGDRDESEKRVYRAVSEATRRHSPGSSWLYAKLYPTTRGIEPLLAKVGPLLVSSITSATADRAFFVRYADDNQHLRVRVRAHGRPEEATAAFLQHLRAFQAEGFIERYSLESYERELERYGGEEAMDAVEEIFTLDSLAALHYPMSETTLPYERAEYALSSLVPMLAPFATAGQEALGRYVLQRKLTADQWNVIKKVQRGIETSSAGGFVFSREPFERLDALSAADRLTAPLSSIVASLIHMHLNRFGIHGQSEAIVATMARQVFHGLEKRAS